MKTIPRPRCPICGGYTPARHPKKGKLSKFDKDECRVIARRRNQRLWRERQNGVKQ